MSVQNLILLCIAAFLIGRYLPVYFDFLAIEQEKRQARKEAELRRSKALNALYQAIIDAPTQQLIDVINRPNATDLAISECIKELRRRAVII